MDFTKIRCPECYRLFCCPSHRADHQVKQHSKVFSKRSQDHLVRVFEKKAEKLLKKSQTRKENTQKIIKLQNNRNNEKSLGATRHLPAVKRLYSEVNKRIFTTSISVSSETRKILVPIHRIKPYNALNTDKANEEKPLMETKESIVKTSTPITNPLSVQKTPLISWNDVSPASTISNYATPPDDVAVKKFEEHVKLQGIKTRAASSPLRGIISKVSKYDQDCAGPSPLSINTSNPKSRRVTFSFSSQTSIITSPKGENVYTEVTDRTSVSSCEEASNLMGREFNEMKRAFEDSSYHKDSGFFSCVASIFCSAVHTIPSLASWRRMDTAGQFMNGSKRAREDNELEVFGSPLPKRPCYPWDLRRNPIRARKPISITKFH